MTSHINAAFDMSGRVALVTGGNSGIGLGMAKALAAAGSQIVIWGTNGQKNASAVAQLTAAGARASSEIVDVADEEQVIAAGARAVAETGGIDCVITAAGVSGTSDNLTSLATADWRRVLSVNLDGTFFTLREIGHHMAERAGNGGQGGSMIAISSLSALEGAPRNVAYSVAKAGVVAMIRGAAVEYASLGIRANAILPGWIATDMTAPHQAIEGFNRLVKRRVPMQRWGEPADLGGLAVYLASDASSYHTGQTFTVDGGYTIF